MTEWTLTEGATLVAALSSWARSRGYLLALYGSTLSGRGRDLDLLAVPWRSGVDARALVDDLAARLGGTIFERGPGLMAEDSAVIQVGRRFVDIQVRPCFIPTAPR